jgi:ubiquitin-conjugating enzyme E2 variant
VYQIPPVAIDIAYVFGSLVLVDFITGVLHWAEDTWTAPGRSKLLDKWVVRDNIEHHRRPGTIRAGNYWATNRVCIALAAVVAIVMVLFHVQAWQAYFIVALLSQSNQVHLWAHCANPPLVIRWLQRFGLLQSTAHHAQHHKRPYANRYCTTTNYLNPMLDAIAFWRGLEWLFERCGLTVKRATPAREGC